jgi:hypothetical protein
MRRLLFTPVIFLCTTFLLYGSLPGDPVFTASPSGLLQDQHKLVVSNTKVFDGNRRLTPEEVMNIFSVSPKIAAQYSRGSRLRSSGVALLVGGGVVTVGGIVLMVSGIDTSNDFYGNSSVDYNSNYYLGLLVAGLGELMVDGGIACTIVGKIKIRKSVSNYNATGGYSTFVPQSINYKFGLLNNGNVGLRLTF